MPESRDPEAHLHSPCKKLGDREKVTALEQITQANLVGIYVVFLLLLLAFLSGRNHIF